MSPVLTATIATYPTATEILRKRLFVFRYFNYKVIFSLNFFFPFPQSLPAGDSVGAMQFIAES